MILKERHLKALENDASRQPAESLQLIIMALAANVQPDFTQLAEPLYGRARAAAEKDAAQVRDYSPWYEFTMLDTNRSRQSCSPRDCPSLKLGYSFPILKRSRPCLQGPRRVSHRPSVWHKSSDCTSWTEARISPQLLALATAGLKRKQVGEHGGLRLCLIASSLPLQVFHR